MGAGSIQIGHRLHDRIYEPKFEVVNWAGYQARHFAALSGELTELTQDTTTPGLTVQAVVEDSVHLAF